MRHLSLLALVGIGCSYDDGIGDGTPLGQYTLVWEDDFEGDANTALDPDKWQFDVGGDGWGNEQLEYNTDRLDNAYIDGQGSLTIQALKEEYEGNAYTSARIKTKDLFEFGYGRVEARLLLPEGQGLWPAFWLLGADFDEVGWPACGEIDIMEARGQEPFEVHGTVHGPGYNGGDGIGDSYVLNEGTFSDEWHDFAVDIDPDHISWSVDGQVFHTLTPGDIPDGTPWVFDNEWFIILNVAVGGTYVGEVDDDALPAKMRVGHVRVWERED